MANIEKRITDDGAISYRARVRRTGFPVRSKTFARKTDAEAWARDLESKMDRNEAVPTQEASKRTLAEAVDKYLSDVLPYKSRNRNKANQERLLRWWKQEYGRYLLSAVTPAMLVEARDKLRSTWFSRKAKGGKTVQRERSPRTVDTYLMALSAVLTTATNEWEWMRENPMRKVRRLDATPGRVRFLSDEERERLLKACKASTSTTLYPIVMIAISTGMRQGEILSLTWDRVDLSRGVLLLEHTKNGERRAVPLVGKALEILTEYKRVHQRIDTPLVFPSEDGTKHAECRMAWRNAVKKAELTNFRFHDLRHTAASYLAMNGASLIEIAAVLGHKTLSMVKRYSHLSEQHTAAVVERMNRAVFGDD